MLPRTLLVRCSSRTRVRALGVIDLPTLQKKASLHFSLTLDLFGNEISTNAANAFNPLQVTSVLVQPINAAVDRTDGIDVSAHYYLDMHRFGGLSLGGGLTRVLSHTIRDFPGDPVDDELRDLFLWELPYWKANASLTWSLGRLSTTLYDRMIGGLPNYDGTTRLGHTSVYNGTVGYSFSPNAQLQLTVDNLLDTKPQHDPTWTSWPFYTRNWFSPVGREFYLDFNYQYSPRR